MTEPCEPKTPMRFQSRVFQLAKDPEHPDENQDAYGIDAGRGMAAIADGVASGIFSRRWARLLADAVVADDPDPRDPRTFGQWLAARRRAWQEQVDVASLAWFQKPKLREGAFSTLLWVRLMESDDDDPTVRATCRLRARAVGDSCLFCIRDGQTLLAFPIQRAEQLEADPVAIGSVDLGRDELLEFKSLEQPCREGDLVILCTDAVAHWALKRHESDNPPNWQDYWSMDEETWREEVHRLRAERQMRYDDATLVILRLCLEVSGETREPNAAAATPESAATAAGTAPPPYPGPAEPDWRARFRQATGQLVGDVSERVSLGVKKLRRAKESAESAIRKYRDKLRDND